MIYPSRVLLCRRLGLKPPIDDTCSPATCAIRYPAMIGAMDREYAPRLHSPSDRPVLPFSMPDIPEIPETAPGPTPIATLGAPTEAAPGPAAAVAPASRPEPSVADTARLLDEHFRRCSVRA